MGMWEGLDDRERYAAKAVSVIGLGLCGLSLATGYDSTLLYLEVREKQAAHGGQEEEPAAEPGRVQLDR